jgi:hypothetical protein
MARVPTGVVDPDPEPVGFFYLPRPDPSLFCTDPHSEPSIKTRKKVEKTLISTTGIF